MIEFWRAGGSLRSTTADAAREAEAQGWDGQMFMDSQSLSAEPYALMGGWAFATQRLKLSTGVTNPLSRHPAVTAAGAATIHAISGGRAVLGIGRGDSALAYLGLAPAPLALFERTLLDLQALLRGEDISFADHPALAGAKALDTIALGHRPSAASLRWLPKDLPKVPLDVAATGPKVIEMGARIAERLTFSVGAQPERLRWAIETAEAARRAHGLPQGGISYGAQIIVVCHPDIEAMRPLVASMVVPLARFQVIERKAAAGPVGDGHAEDFGIIAEKYDMTRHGDHHATDRLGTGALSPEFVQQFAIFGPPEHCIERLLALARLGLERFVVVGPGFHPEAGRPGTSLFAREVIPAVRAALA